MSLPRCWRMWLRSLNEGYATMSPRAPRTSKGGRRWGARTWSRASLLPRMPRGSHGEGDAAQRRGGSATQVDEAVGCSRRVTALAVLIDGNRVLGRSFPYVNVWSVPHVTVLTCNRKHSSRRVGSCLRWCSSGILTSRRTNSLAK